MAYLIPNYLVSILKSLQLEFQFNHTYEFASKKITYMKWLWINTCEKRLYYVNNAWNKIRLNVRGRVPPRKEEATSALCIDLQSACGEVVGLSLTSWMSRESNRSFRNKMMAYSNHGKQPRFFFNKNRALTPLKLLLNH